MQATTSTMGVTHAFSVDIMITEQIVVSFILVVVKSGRIHSASVLSTTWVHNTRYRLWAAKEAVIGSYVLVNLLCHGTCKASEIDAVARTHV